MKRYRFELLSDEQDNCNLDKENVVSLPLEDVIEANSFNNACIKFMKKHCLYEMIDDEELMKVSYINDENGMECCYQISF